MTATDKGQLAHRLHNYLAAERQCLALHRDALRLQRDMGRVDVDSQQATAIKSLAAGIATTKARAMLRSLETEQTLAEAAADSAWDGLTTELERLLAGEPIDLEQVFNDQEKTIALAKKLLTERYK